MKTDNPFGPYFSLDELCRSETADRCGLLNVPGDTERENLLFLTQNILYPLRAALDSPIIISSGFRDPQINKLVGGEVFSQHLTGEAVDLVSVNRKPALVFAMLQSLQLPYLDQAILEFGRWVHVSISDPRDFDSPHKADPQFLVATRDERGKVNYQDVTLDTRP